MLAIFDGQLFNDNQPHVDYIIKDIVDGELYSILIDEFDVAYVESTTSPETTFDIIDDLTGAWYGLFVYNGIVQIAPIKTHLGDTVFGTSCFISAGATINLKINRTTDTETLPEEIDVSIFSHELETFLSLEVQVEENTPNFFTAPFIIPVDGEFLAVIKTPDGLYLSQKFVVQKFSYEELIHEIDKANDALVSDYSQAFI